MTALLYWNRLLSPYEVVADFAGLRGLAELSGSRFAAMGPVLGVLSLWPTMLPLVS